MMKEACLNSLYQIKQLRLKSREKLLVSPMIQNSGYLVRISSTAAIGSETNKTDTIVITLVGIQSTKA